MKLQKEHSAIKEEINEITKKNNIIVDEMYSIIQKYAEELDVDVSQSTNYLFTSNLKELTGAILHKLVFIYRMAGMIELEKKMGYKLPIIIDSPSGKEVDRDNVNAMMKILSRDFKDNQIIVASIYMYDFSQCNIIKLDGRLIDQQVQDYI